MMRIPYKNTITSTHSVKMLAGQVEIYWLKEARRKISSGIKTL